MNQVELLQHVADVLGEMQVSYMIVGSYGSGAWGEPRFSQDIDILVSLTPDDVGPLVRAFPDPEYYLSAEAAKDAIRRGGQFNVIHIQSANKVDFMVSRRGLRDHTQMSRRRKVKLPSGPEVWVAAPEDVILGKMEYYREGGSEKHLRDILGVLRVSGDKMDRAYVAQWVQQLDLTEIWEAVLRRVGEQAP